MDSNIKTVSEHEQKTYSLFKEYFATDRNWTPSAQMVATVFNAFSGNSYEADQIERIACAVCSQETVSLKETLTLLVKAKVLRSRMSKGKRYYEVNF